MTNFKIGQVVRFKEKNRSGLDPHYHPPFGTTGKVVSINERGSLLVDWGEENTPGDGMWYCSPEHVEYVCDGIKTV